MSILAATEWQSPSLIVVVTRRQPPPQLQGYLHDSQSDSLIQSKLASQSHLPPSNRYPSYYGAPGSSIGTSQMVSGSTRTTGAGYSGSLPALSSTASSRSYTGSEASYGGGGMTNKWLLEDEGGGLQIPSPPRMVALECPFNFIDCAREYSSFQEWYRHSLTHFGSAEPPSKNQCCLCDTQFIDPNGSYSWYQRMYHIATVHHFRGERLSNARFDFGLYHYLWSIRQISDADYQNLKGPQVAQGYATQPGIPYQSASANMSNAYTVSSSSVRRR